MGRHRRPSKVSPLIAGAPAAVAAGAVFITPAAHAADAVRPAPEQTATLIAAAPDAIYKPALVAARTVAPMVVYPGDTLWTIARTACGNPDRWSSIYARNRAVIGSDPDVIIPGQKLVLDCRVVKDPPKAAPPKAAAVISGSVRHDRFDGHHGACGDGDGDGMDASCSVIFPTTSGGHHRVTVRQASSFGNVNPDNYSGFQHCVISRESGGNSQVMNSSGHYGLYQFSASTWRAYGGSSADFGHASASEQTQIFNNAMAQGGQSNWSPYDGC
jgi:LysM repeat protein